MCSTPKRKLPATIRSSLAPPACLYLRSWRLESVRRDIQPRDAFPTMKMLRPRYTEVACRAVTRCRAYGGLWQTGRHLDGRDSDKWQNTACLAAGRGSASKQYAAPRGVAWQICYGAHERRIIKRAAAGHSTDRRVGACYYLAWRRSDGEERRAFSPSAGALPARAYRTGNEQCNVGVDRGLAYQTVVLRCVAHR